MRKLYLLIACCIGFFANAQNTVDFTTAVTGNVATFTNKSVLAADSAPKKAFWSFGDGTVQVTSPLANTQYYYGTAGAYQACLRIYRYNTPNFSDSTLLGQACKTVAIQERCEAGFTALDTTIAGVHTVTFYWGASSNSGKSITQVCWNFGDGSDTCFSVVAGTAPTFVHRYAQAGTYNVCLRVKFDGGCTAEKCQTVIVNNTIPADSCASAFTAQPVPATSLGRKFIAQPWHSAGKKPVRICWVFGDGKDTCVNYTTAYTGDYAVEHRYAAAGNHAVCATIKYDGGCEKQSCGTVSVVATDTCILDLAEVPVTASSLERTFYVGLMQNRVAEKLCWSFGDGTDTCIVLSNPVNAQQLMISHRYAAPGSYTVCARVTYAGGCTAQRCRMVSVTIANSNLCGGYVTDSLANANTFLFKAVAVHPPGDAVSYYNWTFGDGTTGSGQNVYKTFASPGRYNVCLLLRTAAGCEVKICKPVTLAGTLQPQLVLTPNPVTTVLNANFTSLFQQTVSVKIYNANGLMVRSYARAATTGANNWTFSDVGTLPAGIYSVVVQSANQFATAIFFKQ